MSEELRRRAEEKEKEEEKAQLEKARLKELEKNIISTEENSDHLRKRKDYKATIICINCGFENIFVIRKGKNKDIIFELKKNCINCECRLYKNGGYYES